MQNATKTCTQCKQESPLALFSKHAGAADGLQARCKQCVSAYMKARTIAKRDELREKARLCYAANREARIAKVNEYRKLNPEKVRLGQQSSYVKHKDKRIAQQQEYMARPGVKKRQTEWRREYYLANRDMRVAESREYRRTERGKEVSRAGHAKEKRRHQQKIKARRKVAYAVFKGRLIQAESCQRCGSVADLEAHHYKGYAPENWLEVRWLCLPCHKVEDREQEEAAQ